MKNFSFKIFFGAALLAFFLNLFFGRLLAAKISTWPLLNRLHILNPQTPIVINNREEIRLVESGQLNDAVNFIKPKISSVILKNQNDVTWRGAALNLTPDGDFVAAKESFAARGDFFVLLLDGRTAHITTLSEDSATGLIFFHADLKGVATAPLTDSASMLSGEKIIYFSNALGSVWEAWPDYLAKAESVSLGEIVPAGKLNRRLWPAALTEASSGKAVLNMKGEVVGLVSAGGIIPADVIRSALGIYISHRPEIPRADFEFSYKEIFQAEAEILQTTAGPVIFDASSSTGLKKGDIIVSVGGQKPGENVLLEELLEKYEPLSQVNFQVQRQEKILDLNIKPKKQ